MSSFLISLYVKPQNHVKIIPKLAFHSFIEVCLSLQLVPFGQFYDIFFILIQELVFRSSFNLVDKFYLYFSHINRS